MKLSFLIFSFFFAINLKAEEKCLCGTYRHDYAFTGNSTNHYRLMDGTVNPALIRDTERATDGKWVLTEVNAEWPGRKKNYIPALDQLANDGDKLCIKGEVLSAVIKSVANGASENLTYYESVENIFKFGTNCEGDPVSIHIDAVKKAELPH